jgi:hypothetical protein
MHYRLLERPTRHVEDDSALHWLDVLFGVTMFALCVWGACVMVP